MHLRDMIFSFIDLWNYKIETTMNENVAAQVRKAQVTIMQGGLLFKMSHDTYLQIESIIPCDIRKLALCVHFKMARLKRHICILIIVLFNLRLFFL